MYTINRQTRLMTDRTPRGDKLLNATLGFRSAGSFGDLVIMGGPTLGTGFSGHPGGIVLFAFRASTGAFLGSHLFPEFNNIRRWVAWQPADGRPVRGHSPSPLLRGEKGPPPSSLTTRGHVVPSPRSLVFAGRAVHDRECAQGPAWESASLDRHVRGAVQLRGGWLPDGGRSLHRSARQPPVCDHVVRGPRLSSGAMLITGSLVNDCDYAVGGSDGPARAPAGAGRTRAARRRAACGCLRSCRATRG